MPEPSHPSGDYPGVGDTRLSRAPGSVTIDDQPAEVRSCSCCWLRSSSRAGLLPRLAAVAPLRSAHRSSGAGLGDGLDILAWVSSHVGSLPPFWLPGCSWCLAGGLHRWPSGAGASCRRAGRGHGTRRTSHPRRPRRLFRPPCRVAWRGPAPLSCRGRSASPFRAGHVPLAMAHARDPEPASGSGRDGGRGRGDPIVAWLRARIPSSSTFGLRALGFLPRSPEAYLFFAEPLQAPCDAWSACGGRAILTTRSPLPTPSTSPSTA